jgi:Protein of unknown function (DUF3108)
MSSGMRATLATLALLAGAMSPAMSETLRASYDISLLGLPIGTGTVNAEVGASSYAIDAAAKLNALASLIVNSRGASHGRGEIVGGRVSPATFATTAANSKMTRTIRMAMKGNSVVAVDIDPPFEDKPDRVPVRPDDKRNVIDPAAAFVLPAPKGEPPLSPAACNRTLSIFDGWTRFDLKLTWTGEHKVAAKGYNGQVAVCAVRYVPIAGYRPDRPATKFMQENKDLEVWLAPVGLSGVLMPFRISVKTMVGMVVIEASEFEVTK